jgi:hypothetical protein
MKLKIIGLVALSAMALMAFAASSVSAKVCSTSGTGEACTSGKVYTGEIDASLKTGTSATLTATNSSGSSVSTVTCTSSTVKGVVTNGSLGTGDITSMTFASCSSAACSNGVTATTTAGTGEKQWPAQATATGGGNGTLAVEKVEGSFVCGTILGNITCTYKTAKATTTVTGGEPAHVTATNIPLERVSGAEATCGTKADWSGTYVVTTPASLWLF